MRPSKQAFCVFCEGYAKRSLGTTLTMIQRIAKRVFDRHFRRKPSSTDTISIFLIQASPRSETLTLGLEWSSFQMASMERCRETLSFELIP
ncbi:hypothetical protein RMSM_01383 [Rhodopirellula maiorica SM1]|uniref:Uncharacterized protein n=1 Tax=Rhodopirellula maiorica SM1 TaxID=1265738 RepID=M5RR34_9BACT|nr:hypothetical protein RMSM_01383 [Rhodopirellula maiorica SM1]